MKAITISLIVNVFLIAIIGAFLFDDLNIAYERQESNSNVEKTLIVSNITFTDWELKTWLGIKNRLTVVNTDPNFSDPSHRVLQWISMRNSSSASWDNFYQKSMEWLCFWEGQGANGEWEAVVSIYNSPNSTTNFVVEVSRFTWHSLNVTLDGNVKAFFPQVTNDAISLGYTTFLVPV